MSAKHTPTPWQWYWREDAQRVGITDCGIFHESRPGHAYSICRAPQFEKRWKWEANAAFIVRACNSHEALVKAAQRMDEAFGAGVHDEIIEGAFGPGILAALKDLRAALHLAREGDSNG